jgi:hypothetical protein
MIWLIVGGCVTLILIALVYLTGRLKVTVHWYEWILGAFGLVLSFFSFQNYYASRLEFEPIAPSRFLLIFGLPGILLITLAMILVVWNKLRRKPINNT